MFKYRISLVFLIFAILQIILANGETAIKPEYATYEEVKDLANYPEKYLIDVRSKDMVANDGSIPTSINIPFTELEAALDLKNEEFKAKYGGDKPPMDAVVIFSCLGGKYAEMSANVTKEKGWKNAKPYLGSWMEWSRREGLA